MYTIPFEAPTKNPLEKGTIHSIPIPSNKEQESTDFYILMYNYFTYFNFEVIIKKH